MLDNEDLYECESCANVDIGTVIKEDDTILTMYVRASGSLSARERFQKIEQSALSVGSGDCKIQSETVDEAGETVIKVTLDFDCAAEKMIFQLKNN